MSNSNPFIFSLTYASEMNSEFDESELVELVDKANQKNKQLEITGYLCYFGNSFLQYLEGEESRVRDLMKTIARDHRHHVIKIVDTGSVSSRRFPTWSMRLISSAGLCEIQIEHILRETIRGFSQKALNDNSIKSTLVNVIEKIASRQSQI